jgi:hypothetical protein
LYLLLPGVLLCVVLQYYLTPEYSEYLFVVCQ